MNNKPIVRHVVFTRATKNVVSALFKTMEQAIGFQDLLNKTAGRCQYFAGCVYYTADPTKKRYILSKTHPEGLNLPLTPPPVQNQKEHKK